MPRIWAGKRYEGIKYTSRQNALQQCFAGQYPTKVQFRFETAWIVCGVGTNITTVTTPEGVMLIGYDDIYFDTFNDNDMAFFKALCSRECSE